MPASLQLFTVTRWLLKVAMLLDLLLLALLVVTLGAIAALGLGVFATDMGMPQLTAIDRAHLMIVAGFAVATAILCVGLVFFALRATAAIVETATLGDPFVTANAARLMQIGWLLLAVEIAGSMAHPVFNFLVAHLVPASLLQQANLHFDFGFGMSPVGLLAVLLIFVLAQIFRSGSEMRAELEATV